MKLAVPGGLLAASNISRLVIPVNKITLHQVQSRMNAWRQGALLKFKASRASALGDLFSS